MILVYHTCRMDDTDVLVGLQVGLRDGAAEGLKVPCRFPTTTLGEARQMVEDTTFWRRPVVMIILNYVTSTILLVRVTMIVHCSVCNVIEQSQNTKLSRNYSRQIYKCSGDEMKVKKGVIVGGECDDEKYCKEEIAGRKYSGNYKQQNRDKIYKMATINSTRLYRTGTP